MKVYLLVSKSQSAETHVSLLPPRLDARGAGLPSPSHLPRRSRARVHSAPWPPRIRPVPLNSSHTRPPPFSISWPQASVSSSQKPLFGTQAEAKRGTEGGQSPEGPPGGPGRATGTDVQLRAGTDSARRPPRHELEPALQDAATDASHQLTASRTSLLLFWEPGPTVRGQAPSPGGFFFAGAGALMTSIRLHLQNHHAGQAGFQPETLRGLEVSPVGSWSLSRCIHIPGQSPQGHPSVQERSHVREQAWGRGPGGPDRDLPILSVRTFSRCRNGERGSGVPLSLQGRPGPQ